MVDSTTKVCLQCNEPISHKSAIYCSPSCRYEYGKAARGIRDDISRSSIGAIAELLVCADLLDRGLEVFRSVSPTAKCDLICYDGQICTRIEVRKGMKSSPNASIKFHRKVWDDAHVYAVVMGEFIEYVPADDSQLLPIRLIAGPAEG